MKRQKVQIIHDILAVIMKKGGSSRPTNILYKANLSHAMMEEYLGDLKEKGLIEIVEKGNSRVIKLTDDGYQFLDKYKEISTFMNAFGIE